MMVIGLLIVSAYIQELAKADPAKAKEMANEMRRKEIVDFQATKKGAKFGYGNEVMCDCCKKYFLTIQRCGRCKVTWYCSAKCQKDDWSTHKFVCAEEEKRRKADMAAKVLGELAFVFVRI